MTGNVMTLVNYLIAFFLIELASSQGSGTTISFETSMATATEEPMSYIFNLSYNITGMLKVTSASVHYTKIVVEQQCSVTLALPDDVDSSVSDPSCFQPANDTHITISKGQVLTSATVAHRTLKGYVCLGRMQYGPFLSEINISQDNTLHTPFTLPSSEAVMTVTGNKTIIGSGLRNSFANCTPAAYAAALTSTPSYLVTSLGASATSTLTALSDPSINSERSRNIVLGITVALAISSIIAFVVFALWFRFYKTCSRSKPSSQSGKPGSVSIKMNNRSRNKFSSAVGLSTQLTVRAIWHLTCWRAPWVMFIGMIGGLTFAVAHHFIYASLDGYPVTDFHVSQSWWLRIGTGLAFMTKICFAMSVGTALVQAQWMKQRQEALTVRDVDALSNVLSNVLSFLDSKVWLRVPSLTSLAVISWLLSLAPLLTPGTLTVAPAPYSNVFSFQAPQLNYSNWDAWTIWDPNRAGSTYVKGAIDVSQVVLTTAVGGQILPMSPVMPNATFHLDFIGPAIKCVEGNSSLITELQPFFASESSLAYFAAIPGIQGDPYYGNGNGSSWDEEYLDQTSPDYSKIYFIINDNLPNLDGIHITECGLYNSLYSVDFAYENSLQVTANSHVTYLQGVPFSLINNPDAAVTLFPDMATEDLPAIYCSYSQIRAYGGLMAAFGSLVLGELWEIPDHEAFFTKIELLRINLSDVEQFRQGMDEVFQNITISLLSQTAFLEPLNQSSWIQAEASTYLLAYAYNAQDLLLIYGLAFLFSLCCSLFGFYAFTANGGSYRNQFSTFMRATIHNDELRSIVSKDDDATDPRSQTLANVKVRLMTTAVTHKTRRFGVSRRSIEYQSVPLPSNGA